MAASLWSGCQKMERPALGDYPKDVSAPGGPLKFYVAFDGITKDSLLNAVDSIMANFPSTNPLKSIDGVSRKAVEGEKGKYINYASTNGFVHSSSFSISLWIKTNIIPEKESLFLFSVPTTVGHWSNATMFALIDHKGAGTTVDGAVLKFFILDKKGENWFEFTGNDKIPGLLNNAWHHLVFTYNETNSTFSLYKDGVLYKTRLWNNHGKLEINSDKVTGLRLLGKTTDWGEEWQGGMDQFRLYGKALSEEEIAELYKGKK